MAEQPKTIFGHPRGLYVLFFTEMWERFSFYGMKTLLMLYMLNHFFWSQERASDLLGTYAMLTYGLPVFGGFIADRWLGAKRSVLLGGILLSIGHLVLAFEEMWCFYTALGLIIAGVGLLKPNVSTQVGNLYPPDDPRRDGAFTIFYMGINLGAFFGPLLCDWLREHYGYSYGFGAAGVGMIFGLIVYAVGQRKLVEFRQDAEDREPDESGKPKPDKPAVVPPHVIRDRIIVLLIVFAFVILFWTAFEQSPNAMLVWADKHTNLRVASLEPPPVTLDVALPGSGTEASVGFVQGVKNWFSDPRMTSGQTQSINPFFIILLAPLFAWLWTCLDRRKLQPSTPTKMTLGLLLVAIAFAVMLPAALSENAPVEAPLARLPDGLAVDDAGRIFAIDDATGNKTFYGATRLRFDADGGKLRMSGVLPDLDRFRLLAETAPDALRSAVATFAEKSTEESAGAGKNWSMSTVLNSAPSWLGPIEIQSGDGANRKTLLTWNPDKKALTAVDEVKERPQIEFLAAAAPPDFKAAVDQVYLESSRNRVTVWWLVLFFMCLTMGELCLSPVGLSLVTKLAPAKHVGLLMGGWFLATAIAEKLAQVFGAYWGKMPPSQYFLIFIIMCGVGAAIMALVVRTMKRMMHGVH